MMDRLITQGNTLFANCGFTYYICGGFALELFAGKTMRPHSDLDISAFQENKREAVALFQQDGWDVYKRVFEPGSWGGLTPLADENDSKLDDARTIWAIKQGSHLIPKPRVEGGDVLDFEISSHQQTDFNFIEMVFDRREGNNFICHKDKDVVRDMDKAILCRDGVPYLAPEIILFLKSPQVYSTHEIHREKTPADFKAIMPLLPDESRRWLIDALDIAHPDGYSWLDGLL